MKPQEIQALQAYFKENYAICNYVPSPNQTEFHKSNKTNRMVSGAMRCGKTLSCLVEIVWLALGIHPYKQNHNGPLSILIICLTRQQASQVTQRKLMSTSEMGGKFHDKPLIPAEEIADDSPSAVKVGFPILYQIKLRNGTVIEFAWSDDPKSWLKAQGSQRDLVYLDEALCSKQFLHQLRARLRDSRSEAIRGEKPEWCGSLLWGATGTGVDEAFESFREYCNDGKHPDHELFILKPGETGAIDQRILELDRATMTEAEARVFIDGTETAAGINLVYGKQWDDKRHVLPEDHVISAEDNLWLGYDPGTEHETGMVIIALSPRFPYQKRVVKAWLHANQTLDYDIECLERFLCGRRLAGIVYDTQAKNRTKHAHTVLDEFMQKMAKRQMTPHAGFYRSHKNHWQGILATRLHLDPDLYNKTVEPRLVLNPSVESGVPMLRRQFLAYRGKEESRFTGPGALIRKNDDLADATRYLVMERMCAGYNALWRCGGPSKHLISSNAPAQNMPNLPQAPKSWHEQLIERSEMAQRIRKNRHAPKSFFK